MTDVTHCHRAPCAPHRFPRSSRRHRRSVSGVSGRRSHHRSRRSCRGQFGAGILHRRKQPAAPLFHFLRQHARHALQIECRRQRLPWRFWPSSQVSSVLLLPLMLVIVLSNSALSDLFERIVVFIHPASGQMDASFRSLFDLHASPIAIPLTLVVTGPHYRGTHLPRSYPRRIASHHFPPQSHPY